jgi:Ca2+-binding EF-hand superfamily protein
MECSLGDDDDDDDDCTPEHRCTSPRKKAKRRGADKIELTVRSSAADICRAYFTTMDLDGNGYIEENEMHIIAMFVFLDDEEGSDHRWRVMVDRMDTDHDNRISWDEYSSWFLSATNDRQKPDGTFEEHHAVALLSSLRRLASVRTARALCGAFFEAMDRNGDGFLVREELLSISKWAFGATPDQAAQTWEHMKDTMDTNHDSRISLDEYSTYWLRQTRSKIQDDGSFHPSYRRFLLKKLAKLEIGRRKQSQIERWNDCYKNDDEDGDDKQNGNHNHTHNINRKRSRSNTKISFQIDANDHK